MLFVFICNIAFFLWISIYKIKYLSSFFKGRGFFNPFVVVFLIQLPIELSKLIAGPAILLEKGVYDNYYNYSLFTTNLSLLIEFILMVITIKISIRYSVVNSLFKFKITAKRMLLVSSVFYFLYVSFFVLLSSNSYGLINWIKNPREGYQLHRTGAGQYWVFAITCLSVSFTLTCIYTKKYARLFALFFVYVVSVYLLGSKGILLDYFTFLFIILWLRDYKHMRKIAILGLPLAFGILLVNFFSTMQNAGYIELFSYFDHYVNSAMYYKAYFKNQIPLYYGQIYLSDFWGLAPRALFPNKPYAYGITLVNEFFWPGAAELTNTPAFGGPVAYFADFGLIGVVVMTLINPFRFIYYFFLGQLLKNYNYQQIQENSLTLCLFIFFTSPYFLFSLPFPANMIFYILVVSILMFLNRLVIRK